MANVGDNPVCLDSAIGPEDMQKPIKLWPCHRTGGNQVPKDTQTCHTYICLTPCCCGWQLTTAELRGDGLLYHLYLHTIYKTRFSHHYLSCRAFYAKHTSLTHNTVVVGACINVTAVHKRFDIHTHTPTHLNIKQLNIEHDIILSRST